MPLVTRSAQKEERLMRRPSTVESSRPAWKLGFIWSSRRAKPSSPCASAPAEKIARAKSWLWKVLEVEDASARSQARTAARWQTVQSTLSSIQP